VIPMSAYSTLLAGVQSGDLPRGKSLKELMGIALQQFKQDKEAFAQEQRAGGEAGEVSYSYQDPFFEETNLEEEAPAAAPNKFGSITGFMGGNIPFLTKLMQSRGPMYGLGTPPTDQAPSEFETWMATKYGGQSA
jgi:hypothetical protein